MGKKLWCFCCCCRLKSEFLSLTSTKRTLHAERKDFSQHRTKVDVNRTLVPGHNHDKLG